MDYTSFVQVMNTIKYKLFTARKDSGMQFALLS